MPKGMRSDGRQRMTYGRAKEIEAQYLARVARGGKVYQKAVEKEALALLVAFKKEAEDIVDHALKGLAKGAIVHRTKKRLDAFAATKTPLPVEWVREEVPARREETPKASEGAMTLANVIAKAVDEYMRAHR